MTVPIAADPAPTAIVWPTPHEKPHRPLVAAMLRGARGRCPKCGEGALFDGYLTVRRECAACGEQLHHHRADDAPPYFTILIVGHVIVSLVLAVEIAYAPPLWLHALLWIPLTIASSLALLRPIKGAVVGLQWAFYMHGFDPNAEPEDAVMLPAGHPR
jgi:uncharacterized protein (DUF983 family)